MKTNQKEETQNNLLEKQEKTQRGKRGDIEFSQLCVQLPKQLKKDFRKAVIEQEEDNSTVIERLVMEWLSNKT